jgi:hypothetical protein
MGGFSSAETAFSTTGALGITFARIGTVTTPRAAKIKKVNFHPASAISGAANMGAKAPPM